MGDYSKNDEEQKMDGMSTEERKDYALIEILMRLSALEKVLIDNNIIKQEELLKHLKVSTDTLIEYMKTDAEDSAAAINVLKAKSSLKN